MPARRITLGDKIRAFRVLYGLTQADFARRVGAAQSVVSCWERGFWEPKREGKMKRVIRVVEGRGGR